jgi:CheY-like chemotaxis protein
MSLSQSFLLVLEDNPVLAELLVHWLRQRFPRKPVVHAATIAEAEAVVSAVCVDSLIVDINLPDGCGLDFLSKLREAQPIDCCVVMTTMSRARVNGRIRALGPASFLEKPLNMSALERMLLPYLVCGEPGGGLKSEPGFQAYLRGLQPVEIIQMKCTNRASGVLEFLNLDGQIGRVHLRAGEITHAEIDDAEGIDALAEIISWSAGAARELLGAVSMTPVTITSPWTAALMEAAHHGAFADTIPA